MRKLILLIVILGAGWLAYQFDAVRTAVSPVTTAVFNVTPAFLQRFIFSTKFPPGYQGLYLADPAANAAWSRQQQYLSQPQPTGRRQVELRPRYLVSQAHATVTVEPIAVIEKGENFVVVEYISHGGRSRIERDDDGIWISFDEIAPGYKERYRKLQ